jgi:hypothetical protein
MKAATRRRRCPTCGAVLILQELSAPYCPIWNAHGFHEQFDPRCSACWAETCAALLQSTFILMWRAVSILRRGVRAQ